MGVTVMVARRIGEGRHEVASAVLFEPILISEPVLAVVAILLFRKGKWKLIEV